MAKTLSLMSYVYSYYTIQFSMYNIIILVDVLCHNMLYYLKRDRYDETE